MSTLYGEKFNENEKLIASDLPLELRVVHHFFCTMFMPKSEKFEYISEKELVFLWAYIIDAKIDIFMFILDHIIKASKTQFSLPYGMFLNKVFNAIIYLLAVISDLIHFIKFSSD